MASYKQAIRWLADMDDCEWTEGDGDHDAHGLMLSVSASMVRDLWNKTDEIIFKDVKKQIKENNKSLI